jgi:CDGSH-type Zn-finger protein
VSERSDGPARRDARRVVMPGETGPVLMQGPVEVVLEDGSTRRSERPTVALCACGRSGSYPFCDTSHRRRSRPRRAEPPGRERAEREPPGRESAEREPPGRESAENGLSGGDEDLGAVGQRDA